MGPGSNRIWLPLARLGAFFGVVVVAGTLALHAVQPEPGTSGRPARDSDFISRKRRQLQKQLRSIEHFFRSVVAPVAEPASEAPRHVEESVFAAGHGHLLLPEPELIVLPEPDPFPIEIVDRGPFLLPELPAPSVRQSDLPRPPAGFSPEDLDAVVALSRARRAGPDPVAGTLDLVLVIPELILDGLYTAGSACFPRSGSYDWVRGEREGIVERMFDLQRDVRGGQIFTEFLGHWVEREQRFFARFPDSHLSTTGVEDGTAEMDLDEFADEQRKVLWDAARRTYLSKYKFKAEEKIRDDAFYFSEWRGADFVLLPPLMSGYIYWRGLDKRISVGPTWLRLSVEPLSEWMHEDEMAAGASLEWMPKGFPFGLIVTAGLYDGNVEMDFIGIGTSTGMVRKLLTDQREE
jgi:hypothetical protein